MRILILAAHPDDETLGCGGTIARYRGVAVGREAAETFEVIRSIE